MYGFFPDQASTSLPITGISHREGSQLSVYFGYVNGTLSSSNHLVVFTVLDSKFDSMVRAPLFDFCLSADPTRYIKTFASGILNSKTTRVPFSLNVLLDNKAFQPPLLVPVSATVDGNYAFVMPFSVTILDGDGEWAWLHMPSRG